MTMKLYDEDDINAIAEAINEKGVTGTFTVGEMADAVMEIEGGGGGVEPTTSLVLNSNKTKTTGAVTLTAQLMTDRYYSSDDVSENGFVEGATVTFYRMVGSTPNPSTDSAISTSITNSTGVATCNTTLTETSNLYAKFNGITSIPSATSNIVTVELDNSIYTPTLDGTDNIYTVKGTVTTGNGMFSLSNNGRGLLIDGFDNNNTNWEFTCEFNSSGANYQIGLNCGNKNDTDNAQIILGCYNSKYNIVCYNNTSKVIETPFSNSVTYNNWHTLKIVKNGTSMSMSIDNVETKNVTWNNANNPKLYFYGNSWTSVLVQVRNIKVVEI